MKTFAIVLLAFALEQAAPLMANAGTDSAGASTSSSSGANGDWRIHVELEVGARVHLAVDATPPRTQRQQERLRKD